MTQRIRMFVAMARPAVVILLALFAATGMAEAGHPDDHVKLFEVLVVVAGFLLMSVVANDLADEAIDRVNLAGDPSRPLVVGACSRRTYAVAGAAAAAIALTVSAVTLGPAPLAVVVVGILVSLAYSLRPVRLAERGVVAPLVLPAAYVAVPYLTALLAVRTKVTGRDLAVLAALYVGFIGRIVLKDFRDVRGDALFGKRTFLVRRGRRATCALSAACWTAGAVGLALATGASLAATSGYAALLAAVLVLLRALSASTTRRRDDALIAAIAIVGRGLVVTLIAQLSMRHAGWAPVPAAAVTAGLTVMVLGAAHAMARRGPTSRLVVPAEWTVTEPAATDRQSAMAG